ncbi:tumor necrosis factor ligand superfamily member 6-like [Xiphias gladius]|uniref:tumor necrosis factor ligand superfamily member 6-like n=1 Tax=Xiphias gladius TaxID=8245 RepID=UPI001A98B680|nr:tumor necrosis factor ligand superfamily member 6-like [Xiphias gladius]XP_039971972.1 tumor necrosis factor ligand superfamily member 6-like [Xiphias gladius]
MDSHVAYSQIPQGPDQVRPSPRVSQKLLFMLAGSVLCSMAVQAYFIGRLYRRVAAVSASTSNNTPGHDGPRPVPPSRSLAHLTDGSDAVHENQIMHWSVNNDTLLRDMDYRHGRLEVRNEGNYYVYSKVSFASSGAFHHRVVLTAPYYVADITLMQSSGSSGGDPSNSHLGGVFHFCQGCAIFVKVSNTSEILQGRTHNFFGAFMV